MKHFLRITFVTALIIIGAVDAMAIEEAKYEVIKKDNVFEIREYAAHILAETVVEGNLEDAGSKAFKILFSYISGNNRSGDKMAMTAPVAQQRAKESWAVSFMMPGSYTLRTLPEPGDPKVTLRQVPARRMAAVRYSGFWSEKGYLQHKIELESWIHRMGFTIVGDPIWARYNPPFIPWFLRRNEILIPIATVTGQQKAQQSHGEATQGTLPSTAP
jgi:hypothetical protein